MMFRRHQLSIMLLFFLASCTQAAHSPNTSSAATEISPEPPKPVEVVQPKPKPKPKLKSNLPEGIVAKLSAPPIKPPQTARPDNLKGTLMGLTADAARERFGAPNFLRRDDPAEIWQYRLRHCVVDLFLYRTDQLFKVTHFELRGRTVAGVSEPACLDELFKIRSTAKSS